MRQLRPSRVRHTDEPGTKPEKGIAKAPPRVLQRCLLQGRLLGEFSLTLCRWGIPYRMATNRSLILSSWLAVHLSRQVWAAYLVTVHFAEGDTLGEAIDKTADAIIAGGTLRPFCQEEANRCATSGGW